MVSTDGQVTTVAAASADIALRLQQLIAGWRGAERGQPLSALHEECRNAAGAARSQLLPARVVPVRDLDATTLETAARRHAGPGRSAEVRFRGRPSGRFDIALVPMGRSGETPDRWILAVEEGLDPADQVALYGHAVAHLLLERDLRRLGQMPQLDPRDGRTHVNTLPELRLVENTRQPLDRRVLETYPALAALLREPEEPRPTVDRSAAELRETLGRFGWRGRLVRAPYVFTDGRVYVAGSGIRRGEQLRVDALLRAEASVPIALA